MSESDLMKAIRRRALDAGVDLIGVGKVKDMDDPAIRGVFPDAVSVIGIAFRVLRGSFRGIEEGTTFYQYTTTGIETIEEILLPEAMLRISGVIEDAGWLAVPQKRNQMLRPRREDLNPEMLHTEWFPAGAKEPQMDFEKAAVACGLGEIGLSGQLLTDDFGPFQRIAFILTNADLPASPRMEKHLCDGCGACLRACPGHAISGTGDRDVLRCAVYYRGANAHYNPFMSDDAYGDMPDRRSIMEGEARPDYEEACRIMEETYFYPPIKHGYVSSICGRACDRACYAHLEEKNALKKTFVNAFRSREPWKL